LGSQPPLDELLLELLEELEPATQVFVPPTSQSPEQQLMS
jgi:hypothetical protein